MSRMKDLIADLDPAAPRPWAQWPEPEKRVVLAAVRGAVGQRPTLPQVRQTLLSFAASDEPGADFDRFAQAVHQELQQ
jgi:hypothetical protein